MGIAFRDYLHAIMENLQKLSKVKEYPLHSAEISWKYNLKVWEWNQRKYRRNPYLESLQFYPKLITQIWSADHFVTFAYNRALAHTTPCCSQLALPLVTFSHLRSLFWPLLWQPYTCSKISINETQLGTTLNYTLSSVLRPYQTPGKSLYSWPGLPVHVLGSQKGGSCPNSQTADLPTIPAWLWGNKLLFPTTSYLTEYLWSLAHSSHHSSPL